MNCPLCNKSLTKLYDSLYCHNCLNYFESINPSYNHITRVYSYNLYRIWFEDEILCNISDTYKTLWIGRLNILRPTSPLEIKKIIDNILLLK